jgi:hypothetical protein
LPKPKCGEWIEGCIELVHADAAQAGSRSGLKERCRRDGPARASRCHSGYRARRRRLPAQRRASLSQLENDAVPRDSKSPRLRSAEEYAPSRRAIGIVPTPTSLGPSVQRGGPAATDEPPAWGHLHVPPRMAQVPALLRVRWVPQARDYFTGKVALAPASLPVPAS